MSLVSNNIKYLRKKMHLTQEQLAEKIGIKRSLLGAYEEGRADPRLNNLQKMAEIFSVTVDIMIGNDITKMSDEELKDQQVKGKDTSLKILAITVDENERELIDLVPQKASAGYTNGYADPEYLEELPKFRLPILQTNGTYRAFEITGDSMLPMQSGTIVIGKYMEDPSSIRNGKTYILLTRNEGVVYKRVFNYMEENGKLYLVSDNKFYSPYEIEGEEVLELWEATAFISTNLPDPTGSADPEVSFDKLKEIVLDLQQEVIRLKER